MRLFSGDSNLSSQIVTSNVVDNQDDSNWKSQIATSNLHNCFQNGNSSICWFVGQNIEIKGLGPKNIGQNLLIINKSTIFA